ncbi:MAG: hypothetical protein M3264_12015 [Thermoproteota archaeon]|nr:hypothetical protein [Thermoproteota archaeon]
MPEISFNDPDKDRKDFAGIFWQRLCQKYRHLELGLMEIEGGHDIITRFYSRNMMCG